ncbi:MAG: ATP-binding protein [Gemmatimonadota bacterium]
MTTTPPASAPGSARTGEMPIMVPRATGPIDRFGLPGPRAVLFIVLVVRVALIGALAVTVIADHEGLPVGLPLIMSILGGATLALIWLGVDLSAGRMPSPDRLLFQFGVDVMLVTGLVAYTRGTTTPLAALYITTVASYAVVLPVGRGLIAAVASAMSYILVTLLFGSEPPGLEFWTQVGVIGFVGATIAVLGHRLATSSNQQRSLAEALAQVRMEADEILATIQSGVITIDGEGRLAYINPRARRILGGTGFATGEPVLETLRARSRDLHGAILRGITDGARVHRAEASVRRADGTLFPVGVSTTTFMRPGGEQPSVTAIFTDISGLKRLQEFRLRAERLEAVAALSASLAHEIRNPLMAIRSAVEQLAKGVDEDDEDDQVLATLVMRESERLNRLLSEFLDFSRVRATSFEQIDLFELVTEAIGLVRSHPDMVGVTLKIDGEPTMIEGDPDLLHRVASNLVLNAAQALGGRGTVRVEVGMAVPGEGPNGPVVPRAKFVVQDDGPGIPEAVRERLFEPFVTGRPGGTGLGLAIAQRAVASHRGVMLVDTAANIGTTFSIFLPVSGDRGDVT